MPSPSQKEHPVSLADVAKAAGLSRMAVSYALRNLPSVSDETRKRVAKIARELGYFPDARTSDRMSQVRQAKTRALVPIAWINTDYREQTWRTYPPVVPYYEGARRHALEHGYTLEEFWIKAPKMTGPRLSKILFTRGIKGVILTPSSSNLFRHINLQWKHFACVGFNRAVLAPKLHQAYPDHAYNITLALKVLKRFGYRRIGLFCLTGPEHRSSNAYSASLLFFQSNLPPEQRVKPVVYSAGTPVEEQIELLQAWLKREKPDVVLGYDNRLLQWVREAGYDVPRQIGVVHLAIDGDVGDWAGIWQNKEEIGATAVELVIAMLARHQIGVPDKARNTLVRGEWRHGTTLLIPKPKGL